MGLKQAAASGDVDGIRAALDAGEAIDVRDHNGLSALHEAIYGGHLEAAKLLVERGADVTLENKARVDARRAAAQMMPALVEAMTARGVAPYEFPTVTWIDGDFGPWTRALLAYFRQGAPLHADPGVAKMIADDMPADLRALIQAWQHGTTSAWINLGQFELEVRGLGLGTDIGEQNPGMQHDWVRCRSIGISHPSMTLIASWSPGAAFAMLSSCDPEYQEIKPLGTFEDLMLMVVEYAEEEGEDEPEGIGRLRKLMS